MNDTGDIDWKARSDEIKAETEKIKAEIEKLTKDIALKESVLRNIALKQMSRGVSADDVAKDFGISKDELKQILGTECGTHE